MPTWTKWIPLVGQIIDLGFAVADRVRERRARRRKQDSGSCSPTEDTGPQTPVKGRTKG